MPRYHFHVVADCEAAYPPLETLPSVAADSPVDALAKLADQGRLPIAGEVLYLRLVGDAAEYVVPINPEYELPEDWQPDD
jgi:hypothetical protein